LWLARREALWAIKALRDEPLPLFAAASDREARTVPEYCEPAVALCPMTAGGEVVEDYGHVGLTLRNHPVSFLRGDLHRQRIVTCIDAMQARDGCWLRTAGLVLVRQMPGSAKGVVFITIDDETGIANLVIWPKLYERQRRVMLAARMMAVRGRIQRDDSDPLRCCAGVDRDHTDMPPMRGARLCGVNNGDVSAAAVSRCRLQQALKRDASSVPTNQAAAESFIA
jgi:error-prone DNA polymerase